MRFDLVCCGSFWASARDVIKRYSNAKSDIYDFLANLSANPGSGDPVPGFMGKVFKDRWGLKSYGIGKSGGLRIYYYFHGGLLAPFFIYTKKQFADAPSELIAQLVTDIEDGLTPPSS
jgi:hypothetical protein